MSIERLDEVFSYIDLVPNEVKVYLALLQKKDCSPAEVAKISGLNRTNVYDLLISLEKKGACILLQSNQKIYEPVDPKLLMEKLRKRLSVVTADISGISDELSKLYDSPHDAGDMVDHVGVISDPILVLKKFNNLIELAKEEILISSAGESVTTKLEKKDMEMAKLLDSECDRLIYKALKRNVRVHVIVGLNALNKDVVERMDQELLDYENYDIRAIEEIPCKLALIDGEHIAIGLKGIRTGKYATSTLYLRDKGLGCFHRRSFYSYWEEGVSIREIDTAALINKRKIRRSGEKVQINGS